MSDQAKLQDYTNAYTTSEPYKHSVISTLIDDELLRKVRDEVRDNVHFTPKETDIYKIHQSGDLANLDGLDDGALEKLPSLLRLRDAMYSSTFRKYVATITGSGELSGRKTDMAINVYTPGCHLLCHDDVIGSRRVSYILYLTDPDCPWKAEWGGALRLFPTQTYEDDGEKTVTPSPDYSKIIPPAWNQLSFFAVQPGESFHDVEEVYHAESKEQLAKEGGRIRMAISGWYHIPQVGEEGYVKGAEEKWGANSSLKQLQGHPDRYDFPKAQPVLIEIPTEDKEEEGLNAEDIDFLLKYMAPTYLTPDTLDQVKEHFVEQCSVTLDTILSKKFAAKVRAHVEEQERTSLPTATEDIEKGTWNVARPPHKHRYLYQQPSLSASQESDAENDPIKELLEVFLPSSQFRKWLELTTDCEVENYDLIARRFRRGQDYALAREHDGESRLELCFGITPTLGWGGEEEEPVAEGEEENESEEKSDQKNTPQSSKSGEKMKGKAADEIEKEVTQSEEPEDVGGHEVYMAGDDQEDADAAIYKAADADDGPLFTSPASWNKLSIVLRDAGVLKFVKYVSRNAKGDRWDVSASFGVKESDEDDDEEGKEEDPPEDESEEEVFNGFPSSGESDSD